MILAHQIREIVLSYAEHRDAKRFIHEFSQLSFNISENGHPEAIRLAHIIESRLAEVSVGHGSPSALRALLLESIAEGPSNYFVAGVKALYSAPVNSPVEERAFPESSASDHDKDDQ
ncbi:MAG TPA: hypothetical protein VJQ82_18035 [Terriglobales bacterium]|nr:hypothetical protein [Terriglobales bacterium]